MISYYTYPGMKFKDEISTPIGAFHTPDHIIAVVERFYDLGEGSIKIRCRRREIVFPRQIAMYIIREETNLTWSAIGLFFNMNHTSIISGCNLVERKMNLDSKIKRQVEKIIGKI